METKPLKIGKFIWQEILKIFEVICSSDSNNSLKPKAHDQRGRLAKAVDLIALRSMLFLLFFFLSIRYFDFWPALIFSLSAAFVSHLILSKREKIQNEAINKQRIQFTAKKHVFKKIMKMDPHGEFKIFITQVLNGLKGFSEMQINNGINSKNIDIIGTFNKAPIAVNCRKYEEKKEVGQEELKMFVAALKNKGIKQGIFITTSTFSDWAVDYTRSINDNEIKIILADKTKLLEWVELSNHKIYPDKEEIKEIELKEKKKNKMLTLRKKEIRYKRLVKSFFLAAVYLTVLSFFMQNWLADWLLKLYFFIAVVNIALGFIFYYLYMEIREYILEISTLKIGD